MWTVIGSSREREEDDLQTRSVRLERKRFFGTRVKNDKSFSFFFFSIMLLKLLKMIFKTTPIFFPLFFFNLNYSWKFIPKLQKPHCSLVIITFREKKNCLIPTCAFWRTIGRVHGTRRIGFRRILVYVKGLSPILSLLIREAED